MVEKRHDKTSHSKCNVFNGCMLQGYFKYVVYAPPEPKFKNNAFVGSYAHDSIEDWFAAYLDVDIHDLAFAGEHFANTMQEIYRKNADKIPPKAETDAISDDEAICLCLDNFIDFMTRRFDRMQRINMVDSFLPTIVEKRYFQNINGVPLEGYLDAGFLDDRLWLFDWKSSKKPDITAEYVTQATRYALLVDASKEFDFPINDFYVINLRTRIDLAKAHVIITEDMKKKEELELARLWDLMNGEEFPKPQKKNCFFCEYKMRCLAFGNEGATHDWSIPVPYKSYRVDKHIHVETGLPDTASMADAALMEEILEDIGIITPPKPKDIDLTSIDAWL